MESNTKVTVSAIAITSLALACLAVGCARHEDTRSAAAPSGSQHVVAASTELATAAPGSQQNVPTGEDVVAVGDSLPPDVSASVADTLVIPGSIIDLTAEGSPDVVQVTLADGIGRRQAFSFDAGTNLWHASYRVPVKMPERLGLSITAKNAQGRWRRVWVFVTAAKAEVPEPTVSEK